LSGRDDEIVQQEFEVPRHTMAELKVFYGPIISIASAKTSPDSGFQGGGMRTTAIDYLGY
jgi:hypothetical protein